MVYIYHHIVFKISLAVHSSYIHFGEQSRATFTILLIFIRSVPTKDLDTFNDKLTTSLKRIVENGIDMQRMAMIIDRNDRQVCRPRTADPHLTKSGQLRSALESEKGDYFSNTIICDFLYGAEDGSELHPSMDRMRYSNILRSWTSSQWTALLSEYVICSKSNSFLRRN